MTEILFKPQNLTEAGVNFLERNILNVGLCGLIYRAKVLQRKSERLHCEAFTDTISDLNAEKNSYSLCGKILEFEILHNQFSGNDLFSIYMD